MLTVWSRLVAGPGIGYKGVICSQPQSSSFNESLHTGLVLAKKKKPAENKPKKGTDSKIKCKKLNICPDPCKDDEEMDAIAEHVSGRCPKDPCYKVRDPCESFVKKHIGSKKSTSNITATPKTKPAA